MMKTLPANSTKDTGFSVFSLFYVYVLLNLTNELFLSHFISLCCSTFTFGQENAEENIYSTCVVHYVHMKDSFTQQIFAQYPLCPRYQISYMIPDFKEKSLLMKWLKNKQTYQKFSKCSFFFSWRPTFLLFFIFQIWLRNKGEGIIMEIILGSTFRDDRATLKSLVFVFKLNTLCG